jgi:hypothetical protein
MASLTHDAAQFASSGTFTASLFQGTASLASAKVTSVGAGTFAVTFSATAALVQDAATFSGTAVPLPVPPYSLTVLSTATTSTVLTTSTTATVLSTRTTLE